MPRVLITGITGMAGSHLADYIVANHKEWQIFGVKRWRSSLTNIVHLKDQISLADCDLTDPSSCLALISNIRPERIFHLAAQSFVPDSWTNPSATIFNNISMQLNLFEAIRQAKIEPIIQIALSSEEYGKVLPNELPISEKNPFRPLSPYGVSKVAQDMLAYQYFHSYGLKVIRTRAFNHEGPRRGEVFVTSSFAKQIAEIEAGLRAPVLSVGNLNAKRDWSDVRDVVRAYWMSSKYCHPGEDYVISSGTARTIKEMLDYLLSLTRIKLEVKIDPARLRPSDVELLVGDPTKFKNTTGWLPKYSFEQTMSDVLSYWRERVKTQDVTDSR